MCAGQVTRGIAMLREGLLAWQQGGAGLWMPMFLMLQAEACQRAGRRESALQIIDEARGICDDTGERWAMAEVLRSKASFLSSTSSRGEIERILLEKFLKLHNISKRVAGNCEPLAILRAFGLATAEFEKLTSYCNRYIANLQKALIQQICVMLRSICRS